MELLSPRTRGLDLITKLADYQRAGVSEYWTIDPADLALRTWSTGQRGWSTSPASLDKVPSTGIDGFTLDLAAIRRSLG